MPANPYLPIAQNGLPSRTGSPKKVLIIGAGMAGLVAGLELRRAGHEPLILEARGRAGGRIKTIRESFTHGLRAEAGAMHIPEAHDLTMHYVQKFGLKLLPFTMGNLEAYYYIDLLCLRIREARANPDLLGFLSFLRKKACRLRSTLPACSSRFVKVWNNLAPMAGVRPYAPDCGRDGPSAQCIPQQFARTYSIRNAPHRH